MKLSGQCKIFVSIGKPAQINRAGNILDH
jgi:hypothetical protein